MALKYQHYPVALLNSETSEIIRRLGAEPANIAEGKYSFAAVIADPDHGPLVGTFLCQLVNAVKAEIEMVLVFELDLLKAAVRVDLAADKLLVYGTGLGLVDKNILGYPVCLVRAGINRNRTGAAALGLHDNGEKLAVLSSDSKLTMRCVRIEINNITGIKSLNPVAELMTHHSLGDDSALLSVVNMELHGLVDL